MISVCNSKISYIVSSLLLEQVVQTVTTMWTTGGRVRGIVYLFLIDREIRYSGHMDRLFKLKARNLEQMLILVM